MIEYKIISESTWTKILSSHLRSNLIFDNYVIRIDDKIYSTHTNEFEEALNKANMWEKLSNDKI